MEHPKTRLAIAIVCDWICDNYPRKNIEYFNNKSDECFNNSREQEKEYDRKYLENMAFAMKNNDFYDDVEHIDEDDENCESYEDGGVHSYKVFEEHFEAMLRYKELACNYYKLSRSYEDMQKIRGNLMAVYDLINKDTCGKPCKINYNYTLRITLKVKKRHIYFN